MRFAVNCSLLFAELPLLERPRAARRAGFDAVEFWWPFPTATPSAAEVDAFCRSLDDAGVQLVALNFFAGDLPAGERGILSDPARVTEFEGAVESLVRIAERTGARSFNALYGHRLDGVTAAEQDVVALANLRLAARSVAGFGGTVLLEPLSRGLNGRYPLETAADCVAVITAAAEPNIKLLFDTYHLANNGEDLLAVLKTHATSIGHVQIADTPGRGHPGTGTLDFPSLFSELTTLGYPAHIALEYTPQAPTTLPTEFTWLPRP
ncbi:TIM barrel protein [Actinocorallia lasiicapitis]